MTDHFPKWNEPATKGDVIRAIVYINSLIVGLRQELLVVQKGGTVDEMKFANTKYMEAYSDLSKVLADISGKVS